MLNWPVTKTVGHSRPNMQSPSYPLFISDELTMKPIHTNPSIFSRTAT